MRAVERLAHVRRVDGFAERGGSEDGALFDCGLEEVVPGCGVGGGGHGSLHDAEAYVAVLGGVGRWKAGAIRWTREVGRGGGDVEVGRGLRGRVTPVEAAAANDAGHAGVGSGGIPLFGGWIGAVPVEGPLGTACFHVFYAEGVGLIDGSGCVGGAVELGSTGAGDVLPLGFSGKPPGLAGLLGEPAAVGHGLLPADACGVGGSGGVSLVGGVELCELFGRDLGDADGEGVGDADAMRGELVEVAVFRPRGHDAEALGDGLVERFSIGSHEEAAGGDGHGGGNAVRGDRGSIAGHAGEDAVLLRQCRIGENTCQRESCCYKCKFRCPDSSMIHSVLLRINVSGTAADRPRAGRVVCGLRRCGRRLRSTCLCRGGSACRLRPMRW